MWFFSADWHLCHANVIKSHRRQFASEEQRSILNLADQGTIPYSDIVIQDSVVQTMNETIIESTNSVVKENDSLVLLGDFCWTKKFELAKYYRDQIKCKNVYLVWGNHDRPKLLSSLFSACYYQYLWTVDGQKIFTSHFPCRIWDRSHYGSWMLYGHCHNSLWHEDNFQIDPEIKNKLEKNLMRHFSQTSLTEAEKCDILSKVMNDFVIFRDFRLTLDVGVDNPRSGLPFGTPWSFEEIQNYMLKKRATWFSLHSENFQD